MACMLLAVPIALGVGHRVVASNLGLAHMGVLQHLAQSDPTAGRVTDHHLSNHADSKLLG